MDGSIKTRVLALAPKTRVSDPDFLLGVGRDGKYCAWTTTLESVVAAVPDAKTEGLLRELIDHYFAKRYDPNGTLTDELETLLTRIIHGRIDKSGLRLI